MSLAWFGRHEFRLFWRDWVGHADRRQAQPRADALAIVRPAALHRRRFTLSPMGSSSPGIAKAGIMAVDKTYLGVDGHLGAFSLSFSMMISPRRWSQSHAPSMRVPTSIIILSSPASARRRLCRPHGLHFALSTVTLLTTVVLAGPFINVLAALRRCFSWLAAYGRGLIALGAACHGLRPTA